MKKETLKPKFYYIYTDTEDIVNLLSDEDRGKLFSLLFRFARGERPEVEDNPALAIAFKVFSAQIERDFAAYEKKTAAARENGKKGGAPKGNRNAAKKAVTTKTTKTTETKEEEKEEEEKEKDKEEEKDKEKENTSAVADSAAADAVFFFEKYCPGMPKAGRLTKRRRELIEGARSALDGTGFEEYFTRVAKSDFLTGRSGKWLGCSFDWLLKPETVQKVLDGFFDDRAAPDTAYTPSRSTSYNIEELEKIDTLDGLF